MQVEKDSYIIVKSGKKFVLAFAHNPERNMAYIEDTLSSDEPQTIDYDEKSLVACLGKRPEVGKVFGVHVEPRRFEKLHSIGNMVYYRRLSKLEKKAFAKSLDKIVDIFKENGWETIFPIFRIEIRNACGSYAGSYQYKVKDAQAHDVMKLHPETFEDVNYNVYVLAHELGHALWFRRVSESFRARWLAVYNSYTEVNNARKKQLDEMLKALIASQVSVREFMRDLEEEDDKSLFREVLSYFKKIHKMSPEDVNLLLNHKSQVLGEIWPTTASLSVSDHPISALGAKNVLEFFAEAIAYRLTGRQMPKKIESLMDKTFKHIRGS